MILSKIELTNYKQYGGHHVVDIPQSGAIGVIGVNGVGKTTLFEAVEWALYSPSTIRAADVRPRVWRGKTEVKVIIDDPATGAKFIVERELGKGSAKARIYRVDSQGFEEKIVDGASQVTTWVTQKLIGLDHGAFVATFFTRQKELGFFNGSATTRRRDVGKLLGLETIRDAQQMIAEDRKRVQSDARSYRDQSEAQLKDRDFEAEISRSASTIVQTKGVLGDATTAVERANAEMAQAEKVLSEHDALREQDAAIGQRILQTQREHDVAQEQARSATREIERLSSLSSERERLTPVVATRESLENEERTHATNRMAVLRKRELEQSLAALSRRNEDATASIKDAISDAPAPDGNPAWNAASPDVAIEWAATIRPDELERTANALAQAIDLEEQVSKESELLAKYHRRVEELRSAEQSILVSGDPATEILTVRNRQQELNGSISAANASKKRIASDLQKAERVLTNLRTQTDGESCPTCQRPFTYDDTAHVISIFEGEADRHREQLREIDALLTSNQHAITLAHSDLQRLEEATKKLTETRASMDAGNRYVEEQQTKVDECSERLQQVLTVLDRTEPPTVQERDTAQTAMNAWRKVVDAAAMMNRAMRTQAQISIEKAPAEQELRSLAETAYDEARHRNVTEQLQAVQQAQATIDRIDAELTRRDQILATQDTADTTVQESHQIIVSLQQDRTQLGFDTQAHLQAQANVRLARSQGQDVTEQRHRAEVALQSAEHALATISAEHERVQRLALQAEAKQREADDLDLMYREFTEFERYAAAWYAPRLGEITSDLVSQITDGKYDRVEFDSNFSIEVFDGDDEKFPYETFSGGERDAIALCARIALSRVIGGASSTPPGFLVLDEVFGSLDLERRQRLLEMLGAITGADDHFKQVFIISHVDDVRTSPILDEVWHVVETDGGISELQILGVGEDIGEL